MEKLGLNELQYVLSHVRRSDQQNVLLVSRTWYQVMDQRVGLHVILGRGHPDNSDSDSPEILSQIGISSCEFVEFCNDSSSLPKPKRPDLLKKVSFRNFVSSATVQSILNNPLSNLQMLQIDHKALYHLEFSDIDLSLVHCEELEVLRTEEDWFSPNRERNFYFESNYWNINVNAAYLFTKRFPGLNRIKISLAFLEKLERILTYGILTLLIEHSETLTVAEIQLYRDTYMNLFQELTKFTFEIPTSFNGRIKTQKLNHTLRNIDLEFPVSKNPAISIFWDYWLATLRSLEVCHFRSPFGPGYYERIITQNAASLHQITLEWNYMKFDQDEEVQFSTFNCRTLEDCQHLTRLSLRGNWCAWFTHMDSMEIAIGLSNIELLPKSLIRIEISGLPLDTASCRKLCLEFPALKTLKLINVAGRIGYGVQIPVIDEMMLRKQLRKFKVDVGYGDTGVTLQIMKISSRTCHSNCCLRAYLHQDRVYYNRPEDGTDSDEDDEPILPPPLVLLHGHGHG